jgi:hypothetical protein
MRKLNFFLLEKNLKKKIFSLTKKNIFFILKKKERNTISQYNKNYLNTNS